MENMRFAIILILGVLIGGVSVWVWNNYRPRVVISPITPTPIEPTKGIGSLEMITASPAATTSATPSSSTRQDEDAPMTASLDTVAASGFNQSGGASLVEENGKVRVIVLVNTLPEITAPQPAHIHVGSCPGVGAVVYTLNNVVNGKSETLLTTTLAQLRRQLPLVINVHKSAQQPDVYTACGSLK